MTTLTASELQYIATVQYKLTELGMDPKSRSEDKHQLEENAKNFWEYIEKKYGVDITKMDRIDPDGTMVLKD